MIGAIATAGSKAAWIVYAIGAILQFLSLSGNQEIANITGVNTTLDWIIYFVLLIITALLIIKRYNKFKNSSPTDKNNNDN